MPASTSQRRTKPKVRRNSDVIIVIGVAMVVQLATRVDDDQAEEFRETTKKLGLSTADALRMFVSSFNEYQGFPYQVRVRQVAEPFENEREASDFANDLSMRMIADEEG